MKVLQKWQLSSFQMDVSFHCPQGQFTKGGNQTIDGCFYTQPLTFPEGKLNQANMLNSAKCQVGLYQGSEAPG